MVLAHRNKADRTEGTKLARKRWKAVCLLRECYREKTRKDSNVIDKPCWNKMKMVDIDQ